MPEFLLEVGCEELPASFVEKAYGDLRDALCKELTELGVCGGGATACGTPRRLIVHFPNLKDRQEDSVKEQRGPSLQAAYDSSGEPTKALLGFCKSQGIEPSDLRKDEQYVWVSKHVPGLPTSELLESILPRIILGLNFEKSMRWGASRARFARPIRWILAAYEGRALDFTVEGFPSALISYGHRFYAPDPFEAKDFAALVSELKNRFVEVDSEARKASILAQAKSISTGAPEITEDLLDENTFLTEWPTAILGSFPESYLELPEPVLVTAMAKHERMFPVRDTAGKLTNQFIFIRNSGEDETVRKGCEWVLGARFNDARFFYEQDQKLTLDDFLAKTEGVVFQAQLGSVRQRADRLANLAAKIAEVTGGSAEEIELARKAGLYAKADLATGLVSELSSLQGVIGGQYALRENFEAPVASAIAQQYVVGSPVDRLSAILQIADQVDKLAGYLGLGLVPSGSSDPFGLRRAVTILISISEAWNFSLSDEPPKSRGLTVYIRGESNERYGRGALPPYSSLLGSALGEYQSQGFELSRQKAMDSLGEIFSSRYGVLYPEFSRRGVLAAALSVAEISCPSDVLMRSKILNEFSAGEIQVALRPGNIVNAATRSGRDLDHGPAQLGKLDTLNSEEGEMLRERLLETEQSLIKAHWQSDSAEIVRLLKSLLPAINAFFDKTMVMSDDPTERFHRLSLANAAAEQLLVAGDFTKLEG